MKFCPSCKIEKSVSDFFKTKARKDGLKYECKQCAVLRRAKWAENNPDQVKAHHRKYAKRNSSAAVARVKKWREDNPEKYAEQIKNSRVRNPEIRKEKLRIYRETNRDKISQSKKLYRLNNLEKLKEKQRQYRQANKGKILADVTARKRRVKQATPPWTTKEMKRQTQYFYDCAQVIYNVTGQRYHVDHVVPLINPKVCGLHVPWNLQLLPASDNISKSNSF